MDSVEEMCSAIALLNKSKKILDGKVRDIRNSYRNDTYLVEYSGDKLILDGTQPFDLLEEIAGHDTNTMRIKLTGKSSNEVLQYLIPKVHINMLQEVIPSMNEVFINKVNQTN